MMLSRCQRAIGDNVRGICCLVAQSFWTVFYFFYFLLKGKPEWKCETLPTTPKNCCVEAKLTESSSTKSIHLSNSIRCEPPRVYRGRTFTQRITDKWHTFATVVCDYGRRIGRFCLRIALKILEALKTVLLYLWAFLKALFYTNVPSKTLPSTPKPFAAKRSGSGSFNKVEFNADELNNVYETEKINDFNSGVRNEAEPLPYNPIPAEQHDVYEEEVNKPRTMPQAMPSKKSSNSNPSYQDVTGQVHQQQKQHFTDSSLDTVHGGASAYIEENPMLSSTPQPPQPPQPPPAPPAPPPPNKPVRIDSVLHGREDVDRCDGETNQTGGTVPKKKDPPGIGKLPADVMAELHGTQKMRQEREASVQREMTQSCHPDMAQWKTAESDSRYDRSASATPFRASSVGPTMRRLEQVVSRLEDTSDNEAQYVFRPKQSEYMMRKAVFTPVEEAEKIRDDINRMPHYESRPITPAHSVVSGRFTPYGNESYPPSTYKKHEAAACERTLAEQKLMSKLSHQTTVCLSILRKYEQPLLWARD